MKTTREIELPPHIEKRLQYAKRLAWISIAYILTGIVLMIMVSGESQAMKTAWMEDILGLVPPAAFLISSRVRLRRPDKDHPYGYFRAVTIAFLIAALSLFFMGMILLGDSVASLIGGERPTIGTTQILGHNVWMGWLMLLVLIYGSVPAMILGHLKKKPAEEIHDKTLYADAEMNKANWLTGVAAFVGVIGIAIGWWWADALAAALISLDVIYDGFKCLKAAVNDLMDKVPRHVSNEKLEETPSLLLEAFKREPWIRDVQIRMRDHGHIMFGEAFVIPTEEIDLIARAKRLQQIAYALDWRMNDLVVQFVNHTGMQHPEPNQANEAKEPT